MNSDFSKLDSTSYRKFTFHQEIDKAFHTLEGILRGINCDGRVEPSEARELSDWWTEQHKFHNRHPFNEVMPAIKAAFADGVLAREELEDLLWLCSKVTNENPYFDAVTSDLQRLQGIVHGITADGKIEKEELTALQNWLSENEQLCGCYPYDELNSVIGSVLRDGKIDAEEHEQLLAFFSAFSSFSMAKRVRQLTQSSDLKKELTLPGICAVCPAIEFSERYFCLTGFSSKGRRSDFASTVLGLNGSYVDSVPSYLNYLVVGALANPAWAFCCYGRKVEAAMTLRKEGKRLLIVHENDFWDAVEDIRAGII